MPLNSTSPNSSGRPSIRVPVSVLPGSPALLQRVQALAARLPILLVPADQPLAEEARRIWLLEDPPSLPESDQNCLIIQDHPSDSGWDWLRPAELEERLERKLSQLVEVIQLRESLAREHHTIDMLNAFGLELSAERDLQSLLSSALRQARIILHADAGSMFVREGDALRFSVAQNDSLSFSLKQELLPLNHRSLAGYTALSKQELNIPDVYELDPSLPYQANLSFDQRLGYRTRSVLLVPLIGREGSCLGVLNLINRKPQPLTPLSDPSQGLEVTPFSDEEARLAGSLASQMAVALENHKLYSEIQQLFDGFIRASVEVIEARDPTTAGHSQRVAALTVALAQACDESAAAVFSEVQLSHRDLESLRYAALLHDFGKIGVPERVLLKAERLYPWELQDIEHRFRQVELLERLRALQAGREISPALLRQLAEDRALVQHMVKPSYTLREEDRQALEHMMSRWSLGSLGDKILLDKEVSRLCIPYGTLDPSERLEIQKHVEHTYRFLKLIPWTEELQQVPELAWSHHEKLNGSGYPRGIEGDAIPFGSQLMTIADIFDALTASDRPYKASLGIDRTMSILRDEASRGHVNGPAVELLWEKKLWEGIIKPGSHPEDACPNPQECTQHKEQS